MLPEVRQESSMGRSRDYPPEFRRRAVDLSLGELCFSGEAPRTGGVG